MPPSYNRPKWTSKLACVLGRRHHQQDDANDANEADLTSPTVAEVEKTAKTTLTEDQKTREAQMHQENQALQAKVSELEAKVQELLLAKEQEEDKQESAPQPTDAPYPPDATDAVATAAGTNKKTIIRKTMPEFPVTLLPSEQLREHKERAMLKKERLEELLPWDYFPDNVRNWIFENLLLTDDEDHDMPAVVGWLIKTLECCHLDSRFERAVESLLSSSLFTNQLPYHYGKTGVTENLGLEEDPYIFEEKDYMWRWLQRSMQAFMEKNNKLRLSVFEENKLDVSLGNETVSKCWIKNKEIAALSSNKDISQCLVVPTLSSGGDGVLHFDKNLEDMDEQASLVLLLHIAAAINEEFQDRIHEISSRFVQQQDAAPPKSFGRAQVKVKDDYRYAPKPRPAKCKDLIRVLLCVISPAMQLDLIQELSNYFDGLVGLKNPYGLPLEKREKMGHLLITNINIVFSSKMTYGCMVSDPRVQEIWKDFRADSQGEPRDRWERHCDKAIQFLSQPNIANATVRMIGEVQIVLERYHQLREDAHHIYKVGRAQDARSLYEDYAGANKFTTEEQDTLSFAAYHGQLSVVKRRIGLGDDLNALDDNCFTPLKNASQHGHADVVKLLLDSGADVNLSGGYNLPSPLYLACDSGNQDIVQLLVEAGADVDSNNGCGNGNGFPLMKAINKKYMDTIQYLVENGANVNCSNEFGITPLVVASYEASVVQLLLDHGALIESEFGDPVGHACSDKNSEVLKLLLENGADPNKRKPQSKHESEEEYSRGGEQYPIFQAIYHNFLDGLKLLLEHGADPRIKNGEDETPPLVFAFEQCQYDDSKKNDMSLDYVTLLLSHGADVNKTDNTAKGKTPLMFACEFGRVDMVKELLDHGADVNFQKNSRQPTALCAATYEQQNEIVKMLVAAGADLAIGDDFGTPLHQACINSDISMAQLFLEEWCVSQKRNAKDLLELKDDDGWTPLLVACNRETKLVAWLVEQGANVFVQNNDGRTPFHCACRRDNVELLQLLADQASENRMDLETLLNAREEDSGITPLQLAFQTEDPEDEDFSPRVKVMEWLKQAGFSLPEQGTEANDKSSQ